MAKRSSSKTSSQAKGTGGITRSARAVVQDVMERIREIRDRQLREGHFDCYAKAFDGFCDQGDCSYRQECLEMSGLAPAYVPVRIDR